ncbi:hypothetical protein ANN_26552 [Periplaneta americana]|uniref:Transposase n=1 Tax=Periplaneta americana TaxID=6978 RepID=A0ABQ8RYJ6_PERAM|nr:hypothetical protein ANN_26552 [Periplaneta americana]
MVLYGRFPSHKGCKKSIWDGSFLSGQHITFKIFLMLPLYWVYSVSVGITAGEAKVSKVTAIQWYQHFRDICSRWLVQNPLRLGGPGTVVQIDESIITQPKYGVGHVVRE